jgi:hypothetical protein
MINILPDCYARNILHLTITQSKACEHTKKRVKRANKKKGEKWQIKEKK